MIHKRHFPDLDLIVHVVIGEFDLDAFHAAGRALYAMDPVPRLSLWDFSQGSVGELTVEAMRSAQEEMARRVRGRDQGRTAVVASTDLLFGISRQYITFSESYDLPFQTRVFRQLDEAVTWLDLPQDRQDDVHAAIETAREEGGEA